MIKNVFLKRMLQNTVFSFFSFINKFTPHQPKRIMLYSNLGFRDNIKALYDYLVANGYNEKYQLICSTNDFRDFAEEQHPNVKFVSNVKGILYYFTTKYVYYCFGKIPIIPSREQEVIQMWHGSMYKAADKGMREAHSAKRLYYTHILSCSKTFVPILSDAFSFPEDKFIICDQPRNDALFLNWKYDLGPYKKLVLWAPTFRSSKVLGYSDTKEDSKLVPVLDPTRYQAIDQYLKERGVKVIIKLHPLQDLNDYNLVDMQHFVLLSHQEFMKRGYDLYKLASQSDALITDYSSIFFDYLLIDRPIGFTEDDAKDYQDTRGFAVDDPDGYKPGMRIKTEADFCQFIDDLANGIDHYKAERKRVSNLSNDFKDNKSCWRALDSVGIHKD